MALAKEQIRIAFEQSEKEVADLHQRTREGIETARLKGKQIGQLTNEQTRKLAGISRASFSKYKAELLKDGNDSISGI